MILIKKTKIYLLLIITFVIFLMLFSIEIYEVKDVKFHKPISSKVDSNNYAIDTEACKIPSLDAVSNSVRTSFEYTEDIATLSCLRKPRLYSSNDTHLIFNEHNVEHYINASGRKDLLCFYTEFYRVRPKDDLPAAIEYAKKRYLRETIKANFEFVRVDCFNNRITRIYMDFFSFVPIKGKRKARRSDEEKYNVIVLGIDNISRSGFRRSLPRTLDYLLNKLEAIEYFGYTKVGENTFPNLIPLTTGHNVDEISSGCWKDKKYFDRCDFIWNDFRRMDYATAFGEDNSAYGLFVYLKQGFDQQPVDHYWNTFNIIAQGYIGMNQIQQTFLCLGAVPQHVHLINYTLNYARTYDKIDRNYFAFFWINGISHDSLKLPEFADNDTERFLAAVRRLKNFDKTFVLMLSDHGYRWYPFRNSKQGKIESNLPAFYLVVPKWFQNRHPEAYRNLKSNSRKLTSPFDVYETLKNIADQKYDPPPPTSPHQRGVSLFEYISKNRTCADIGFDVAFCPCVGKPVPVDDTLVYTFTDKALLYMNTKLHTHSCYEIRLDTILYATAVLLDSLYVYTVGFSTKPNKGEYEMTIQCQNCTDGETKFGGPILMIGLYNAPNDCVQEEELKNYCMCK